MRLSLRSLGLATGVRLLVFIGITAMACQVAVADKTQVYDGMTATELRNFAERQGWKVESDPSGSDVTIEVEGQLIGITLLKCGGDGVCKSGIIRWMTYHSLTSNCSLWHWNLETRGATGFGPDYVTLQRYFHLRGTTDQYLRDVFDDWLGAAPDFWKLIERCHEEQSKSKPP